MKKDYEIVEVEPQPFLYVHRKSSPAPQAIGAAMGEAFGMLGPFIEAKKIEPAGAPLAVYHSYTEEETVFDVGLPVTARDLERAEGTIQAGETPSGRALKAVHKGAYTDLKSTYDAIMKYMAEQRLEPKGVCWEVYLSDPDKTPEEDLLTEIYFNLG